MNQLTELAGKNLKPSIVQKNHFIWYLGILATLFFIQIWWEIASFTVRIEDLLTLILLGGLLAPALLVGKLRYHRSSLNMPLLLWSSAIALGVLVTFISPFDVSVKKDALVNGIRLTLATSLFFITYNHPASPKAKIKSILSTIIVVSFLTTTVALLQIAYWEGFLPFSLPKFLIEMKEGANTEAGREIFALYTGDTGTHTWAGMLAIQALIVWLLAWHNRNKIHRLGLLAYFCILSFILIRTAVRNSILGLFIVITFLSLLSTLRSHFPVNKAIKVGLIVLVILLSILIVFTLGQGNYFVGRIRAALPQWQGGSFVISKASNIYSRIEYGKAALAIFQDHPILGAGFWSYETMSNTYSSLPTVHAHNSYLQILAELGIIGAIAFAWLLWNWIKILNKTSRHLTQRSPYALIWQLTAGCSILLAFTAFFGNPLWSPVYMGFNMILLSILTNAHKEASDEQ